MTYILRQILFCALLPPAMLGAQTGTPAEAPLRPATSTAERLAAAKAARDRGEHEEAIRLYESLKDDPDVAARALALEGAALLLSWRGEYDESTAYYREVARISPEKRRDAIYGAA